MLIVSAANEAYAMPLATALRSITEANRASWPLEFWVLHDGIDEALQKKVLSSLPEKSALIVWVPVEMKLFAGFSAGTTNYISKITYARLLIPEIFPPTVAKVLYLDADLLLFEDLGSLWQTDLGGAVVGAVADFSLHTRFLAQGFDPQVGRAHHGGLPPVRDYFNAGVLLIDLERWREREISKRAFAYLKEHPRSPHMDQDALNFAADTQWLALDPRWNLQNHYAKVRKDDQRGILHFVTGAKPWLASSRSANAALYDSFRSRTNFARTPTDKLRDALLRFETGIKNVVKRGGFRNEDINSAGRRRGLRDASGHHA
jgi:lipopolysaccharide biosynthesis glycosyltransferase